MAKFLSEQAFASCTNLQLLPLRFERLADDRFLVANLVGDVTVLDRQELGGCPAHC
jgi:hypothetical protein